MYTKKIEEVRDTNEIQTFCIRKRGINIFTICYSLLVQGCGIDLPEIVPFNEKEKYNITIVSTSETQSVSKRKAKKTHLICLKCNIDLIFLIKRTDLSS